jgi:hypothetical protein
MFGTALTKTIIVIRNQMIMKEELLRVVKRFVATRETAHALVEQLLDLFDGKMEKERNEAVASRQGVESDAYAEGYGCGFSDGFDQGYEAGLDGMDGLLK